MAANTVPVTVQFLKELHTIAVANGTLLQWSQIAIEWMDHADKQINKDSKEGKQHD